MRRGHRPHKRRSAALWAKPGPGRRPRKHQAHEALQRAVSAAAQRIAAAVENHVRDGDAHALLAAVYRDHRLPIGLRFPVVIRSAASSVISPPGPPSQPRWGD
jgi:hypothetical protein